MIKNIFITFITVLILNSLTYAQGRAGKMGLVFMEDFVSQPLNCGFSLWINNSISVELTGGLERINIKDNSGTLYNLGLGGLYHFGEKKIVPYIGSRLLFTNLYNSTESYLDVMVGLVFGAEYFFSDWISLAGEFQFNYLETAREYSPTGNAPDATIFKTGRFIILRLYL